MDWTTFLLGAIAGIVVWNKLNPQIRELICSIFSQGECALFATVVGTPQQSDNNSNIKNQSVARKAALTRAYQDGMGRKIPHDSDDEFKSMYDECEDDLSRYIYDYIRGFVQWVNSVRSAPPPPSVPVTRQQS